MDEKVKKKDHRKRKAFSEIDDTESKTKKVTNDAVLKKDDMFALGDDQTVKVVKRRRPWRNKVRKKAAKEAARIQRKQQEAENARIKGTIDTETVMGGDMKKKRKKKKKKKLNVLADEVATSSCENVHIMEAQKRLSSARFRFINEQLYTSSGEDAMKMFREDPQAFEIYHRGYRSQMKKWPFNPVNGVIQWLRTLMNNKKDLVVADMGCGEARIAELLSPMITVHSFDLVGVNERVTACNMAKVPLEKDTVDVVVFCLSLMGTNLNDYLREANRILKKGGFMKIAEVGSRFTSVKQFIYGVEKMGFELVEKRATTDGYFLMMEFRKVGKVLQKRPLGLKLQPCLYKKR